MTRSRGRWHCKSNWVIVVAVNKKDDEREPSPFRGCTWRRAMAITRSNKHIRGWWISEKDFYWRTFKSTYTSNWSLSAFSTEVVGGSSTTVPHLGRVGGTHEAACHEARGTDLPASNRKVRLSFDNGTSFFSVKNMDLPLISASDPYFASTMVIESIRAVLDNFAGLISRLIGRLIISRLTAYQWYCKGAYNESRECKNRS